MDLNFKSPSTQEILKYILKNWKVLFGGAFTVAVLVAIFTLFIPNKYKSTANLLPSQRPNIGLDLFSEKGGLSSLASSVLGGESDETNRYVILLSSHTIQKKVVDRFNLIERYEVEETDDPLGDAIEILLDRSTFENQEEGNFLISVIDEDPIIAKEIADYYIELLNELNTKILSTDARLYREFLEKRYNTLLFEVDSLKIEFIKFQEQYGVFELPEQVKEYFSLLGTVTGQQLKAELELKMLGSTVQKNSDLYQRKQDEYNLITEKLEELYTDENPRNLTLNFNKLGVIGSTYYDLYFQLEIQQEIQKFLLPLYEQAKMEEVKSLPIVTVVDEPQVPVLKSEPRRSIIVILSGISSFILIIFFLMTYYTYKYNEDYFKSLTK